MHGLMMHMPLLISGLLRGAADKHGRTEIVTRTVEGPIHRYTYADAHKRAKRIARALQKLGVEQGERVGTLAWNTHRHFELYYGVAGMGAVCHTVNPRLHPGQIAYIVNHAEDAVLFVDLSFVPLVEQLLPELTTVRHVVVMTDPAHMPKSLPNALCYETLVAEAGDGFEWPVLDERLASQLCYTSGTTGNPKGVLYSHRSMVLLAMTVCLPDSKAIAARDTLLPAVPMFHVNAWGLPYAAALSGAKLVLPGPKLDGASLCELMDAERVTVSAAVPTVWFGVLDHLRATAKRLPAFERVLIGGSAVPLAMIKAFEEDHDVRVWHAWGMTEMSPAGTVNQPNNRQQDETRAQQYARQVKQGRAVFSVEMKIVDADGRELPRDGVSIGELKVRGHSVCSGYYKEPQSAAHDAEGWFTTGDVGTIDAEGFLQITDRSKDLIKSGGEWISSIDLENIAVGHPEVQEAAAIAVPHPKWDERPLLVVVRRPGSTVTREDILRYFDGKIAKWWMPDDIVFVPELPHTATGKLSKLTLRQQFQNHVLPTAARSTVA
jgi:fatty-acyl-CoA synthase